MRISNDVAAVADPGTPLAVYDSGNGGWLTVGGTSAATPIIGGVYALAGNGASQTYGMSSYNNPSALHDITSGSNGSCSPAFICNAGSGFDGPTGNGTPNGVGGF
jgi:subtilase family serine protease